jgi:hypothetical protein
VTSRDMRDTSIRWCHVTSQLDHSNRAFVTDVTARGEKRDKLAKCHACHGVTTEAKPYVLGKPLSYCEGVDMEVLKPPPDENGSRNKGGRPRGSMTFSKKTFIELARKNPREAFENLRYLALHDENSFVRLAATKIWIEYSAGKPPEGEGAAYTGPPVVNVITGVRVSGEAALPAPRPLLPDGRDPFEQPAAPSGSRPMGRALVAEPPQHRLFEGEADKRSE